MDARGDVHPVKAILASLMAFFAACVRPRTSLAKAIVLVLVLKLVGIVGIKVLMFPGSAEPTVDTAAMARLFGLQTTQ
jgi:hypothetical protein